MIVVGISLKYLEKLAQTLSSFNLCSCLPSVLTNDGNSFNAHTYSLKYMAKLNHYVWNSVDTKTRFGFFKEYHIVWRSSFHCTFHKHANVQKPPSQFCFSLPSIIYDQRVFNEFIKTPQCSVGKQKNKHETKKLQTTMSVHRGFKDLLGKNGTLCTSIKVHYICIFVLIWQ